MNRNYILSNVDQLTAQQLFEAIINGLVTIEELRATGYLDASKRRAIEALIIANNSEDDIAWENARLTEQGCLTYIAKYPAGVHTIEAKQLIEEFKKRRIEAGVARDRIVEKLHKNPNSFTPGMIRQYLNNNTITTNDLLNVGIPNDVISCLDNIVIPNIQLGLTPKSIPEGYTEVYFWGIPGSGKTCALAAILGTANKKGYLEIAKSTGYNYAVKLQHIFSNRISFLPAASPVDTTQYLPFSLKKPDEKKSRSVSLIELSGEVFQCFHYKNAGLPMPSSQHEQTFNTLIQFLNSKNRKMHFFFIDYDVENKPDPAGYCQSDYLNAAALFFNDKQNNIFNNTTVAIYIVLTKSDLMPCEKEDRVHQMKEYLRDNNYLSFVNSLRSKCEKYSINAKKILGTPFSLGKVYFNDMCAFDPESATNIIDILNRRIKPKKESILDFFNK